LGDFVVLILILILVRLRGDDKIRRFSCDFDPTHFEIVVPAVAAFIWHPLVDSVGVTEVASCAGSSMFAFHSLVL